MFTINVAPAKTIFNTFTSDADTFRCKLKLWVIFKKYNPVTRLVEFELPIV